MVEIQWFHITRLVGVITFLFGLFVDQSGDRGTILLLGAGMAGFDKVARSDQSKKNDEEGDSTDG